MCKTRLAVTGVALEDYMLMPRAFSRNLDLDELRKRIDRKLENQVKYFVAAWEQGADFVASYESITGAGQLGQNPENKELTDQLLDTVPGPTTERFGALARKHNAYCAICLDEIDDGVVYNTAVLIDRDGKVAGKYRKVHLPPQERSYATPGDGFPVFDTDFGKVGFSICYDIMFPETIRCLAVNGADLVVHIGNTAYKLPEQTVRVRAHENMLWLLASNILDMISMVVDPAGDIVAKATRHTGEVVCVDVDLDLEREMPGDNLFSGVGSLRGRMLQERVPAAYKALTNESPPLLERYADDLIPRSPEEHLRLLEKIKPELENVAVQIDGMITKQKERRD